MEENKRLVRIRNAATANVGINEPDLNLRREWATKGAVRTIPFDILSEAMYSRGVEYLFKNGILVIENKQDIIDLGLEEIIGELPKEVVTTKEDIKKLLTSIPLATLKEKITKMPKEQLQEIRAYMIKENFTDYERVALIENALGMKFFDLIKDNIEEQNKVRGK